MEFHRLGTKSPHLIVGFGAVLFLVALVHHTAELSALDDVIGPSVAFLLDGTLALGVVYAGYWLGGSDMSPENRWLVFKWCLLGATLFVTIMSVSLLVRAYEGRVVGESVFPLLLAAETGGLAGAIAGYQTARARAEANRARTVSDAFGFVNSLIRHDLRNDLNVIQGHAHLLGTEGDSGAAEMESDSRSIIAEKATEALTRIETTDVVAETLLGDADLERTDLAAMTAEIADRVENTYDVPVTTELPAKATVTANQGLRSVVDNLLENAIEHNDADDPQVHVDVEVKGETVELRVADNGPGISSEREERILRPQSEDAEGGLSLVQTLVDEYDGEMRIEPNDPRGSVFVVELPRAEPEQE